MSEFDRQNKQYTREELIEQVNADAQVRAFELLETPSLVPGNFDANHLADIIANRNSDHVGNLFFSFSGFKA